MARIFISHSSRDNFEAVAFRDWLVSESWASDDVFLDLHGIGAGARWKENARRGQEAVRGGAVSDLAARARVQRVLRRNPHGRGHGQGHPAHHLAGQRAMMRAVLLASSLRPSTIRGERDSYGE